MDPAQPFSLTRLGLAVALLIDIERGWRLRGKAGGSRVAGVRTFTLLGLLGGAAGPVGSFGYPLPD